MSSAKKSDLSHFHGGCGELAETFTKLKFYFLTNSVIKHVHVVQII